MRKLGWCWGTMDRFVIIPNIEIRKESAFMYRKYVSEVSLVWGKFFISITRD